MPIENRTQSPTHSPEQASEREAQLLRAELEHLQMENQRLRADNQQLRQQEGELHADIARLQQAESQRCAESRQLLAEKERLRQQLSRARAKLKWTDEILGIPGSQWSPTVKLSALCLYAFAPQTSADAAPVQIYIGKDDKPGLAAKIGVSHDTFSKCLETLEAAGAIRKHKKRDPKTQHTRVSLEFSPQFLEDPASLKRSEGRNHGGARRRCPKCKSENLITEKRIVCRACGDVQHNWRETSTPAGSDGAEAGGDERGTQVASVNQTGGVYSQLSPPYLVTTASKPAWLLRLCSKLRAMGQRISRCRKLVVRNTLPSTRP
jgi:hypothetical protein